MVKVAAVYGIRRICADLFEVLSRAIMSKQPLETDPSKQPADGGVAAVDRAFAILGAFDVDRGSLTLAEIARRTGLYKSTILRLMTSLEKAGFIRRLVDGQYAVGPEPLRLAQIYQTSFRLRDVIYRCWKPSPKKAAKPPRSTCWKTTAVWCCFASNPSVRCVTRFMRAPV